MPGGQLLFAIGQWPAQRALPWLESSWRRNETSPNPGGLPARRLPKSLIPLMTKAAIAWLLESGDT